MQKNVLITGGSAGIGEGLARYFYELKWQVLITGRNTQKLSRLAAEMPGLHVIKYDALIKEDEDKLVQFIKDNWEGKLDVLINNAGHVELTPLKDIKSESMETMYRTHLIAPALLSSKCIDFLARAQGQIVNISSSHGIKAFPQISAYGSAKAAANMLTRIWALELAPLGIRVNAIAPGPTNTAVLENAGLPLEMIQAIHESERTTIPLQRRGEVADIVAATALLISSTWLTGVVLPADGGISIS
jgi:NAD(P)-dependent dehydrogenase (short-subunit alcohol dehydrogenase family)